uniref:Retrovirus-related Pol polyprotein from transposon TNT 1-94 n=1 Tax=Tanacetum cinerariifolium TaxID=118510 RepID=A0A6L2NWF8_TANCI|nr:retrovirus-related Pol polyprotein from transposon TNT 1-94 [Tanacetum cinerariifolium]
MSNLSKLEFGALNVTGKNYMPWVLDVKMHLESMGIAQIIVENNDSPPQDKARANIFLCKHIDDGLKFKYLTTEDPSILWKDLKDRVDNQREVLLPALKFYGQSVTDADMLEKTYSTFHASNMTLQQQYRLQKFTRYSELNAYLLVAEQNNELLMKNHQSRPTRSLAYPEVNIAKNDLKSFMRGQGQSMEKVVFNLAKTILMAMIVLFIKIGKTVEFILMVADSPVAVVKESIKMLHETIRQKMWASASIMVNLAYRRTMMVLVLDVVAQTTGQSLVEQPLTSEKLTLYYQMAQSFLINKAIFSPKSRRNLLSFGDIYLNDYDTQTTTIENEKYLHIIDKSNVLEKLSMLNSGLHYTHLSMAESHMVIKEKSCDPGIVSMWHDWLGHPGSTMMKRIIGSTHGHPLKDQKILQMDKMAPYYTIKRVRLDNAGEFTSQAFNDYCMSVGIIFEHQVAHVHTQNGLAESLIKRPQLIARPLIMRTKLPVSIWGHAILHAASLIRMRPTANHVYSPMQLAFGQEPNISHLRIFRCAVYVPIAPPQRTKMGPQRRLGIYVGYEMIFIIRYLEPLTGDVFKARFADCQFNESIFPSLGGEKKNHEKDVLWSEPLLLYLDPRTKQKKKATENAIIHEDIVLEGTQNVAPPEEEIDDINKEISINYSHSKISLDQTETEIIDEKFCYNVACDIINGNDDPEPTSLIECQSKHDWNKWNEAMQAELNSLNKQMVFGRNVLTPRVVKPVGYRWVFIRKRNENDEVIRYKARLVAQGFSQRPWINYEETYSPVMDAITFCYLISLTVSENLDMRLMDVVTAYLYGSLDSDIYMKIPEGFKMPEALSAKPKDMYSVKLQRSLYGLKQSGRMWYNHLSNYLISKGYKSNLICPCVFIKKTTSGFVIIVVYVNDLNIIGTHKEINEVVVRLKEEFEMKDLDACYLYDPHKARSQTSYVFLNRGTAISWRSQKQTLVATSSNHAEIIALHEASRECVWLRSMTQLIVISCGLNKLTIIHEDNAACVAQMKEGYIKSDMMKHIPPRYFAYTQDLIKDNQIEMKYVQSSNNSAHLFTKALPTSVFGKHVHVMACGMYRRHNTLQMSSGGVNYTLHSFP